MDSVPLETPYSIASSSISAQPSLATPSFFDLFWAADFSIKIIMAGLIIGSIFSWAIILQKWFRLKQLNRGIEKFEHDFNRATSVDDFYETVKSQKDPMCRIFCAGMREWRQSNHQIPSFKKSIEQRINTAMFLTLDKEILSLNGQMSFLSSLGSNAVIIGLLGTVLGIMNSFQSIATQQNTSLSVVAPGIAEALFATAIGLIAAIPASIAFSKFSNEIQQYEERLASFCNEFCLIISRQLDEVA